MAPSLERSRFRGALLGLAAGDALGTALGLAPPGSPDPLEALAGGGPSRLRPGQWSDDTSMALCLAESLIERPGFDPADQMRRYVRWWREGRLSSTGRCFDIGRATSAALARFERSGDPWSGSTDPRSAGNGSIMRLAPVALRWAHDPETAVARAAESSRTTHAAETAVDACKLLAALIVGALRGEPRERLLAPGFWRGGPLHREIEAIAAGSHLRKDRAQVRGGGYVVESLEAALWALARGDGFREGALLAVSLGDDADTTGAVYGQLAGALYGEDAIPAAWSRRLAMRETIVAYADALWELARARTG